MARRHWRQFERRKAAVTLRSGASVIGVLWEATPEFLTLREASMTVEGAGDVPADGIMVLPREHVEFLQVLG